MSTISSSTTSTTAYKVTADTTGALVFQTGASPTTAMTLDASQNVTFAGYANLPNTFGFKNRIINGAMMIDQRNAGASVTPPTGGTTASYTLDRWTLNTNISSAASIQQNSGSVAPPAGFTNYLGITSLSATSVGASNYSLLEQRVEGFNFADMAWGTASANPITISFWVRSSLTGTFGGCLQTSATRFYAYTFTINAANTWEQKTVTIAGDTSGAPATGNTTALYVRWSIACGSTNRQATGSWSGTAALGATGQTDVLATNGATFYITGVQLEKGSTATSFDYRPYGTELSLCQRYCINYNSANANGAFYRYCYGECTTAVGFQAQIQLPVTMRTTPSVTTTGTAANYAVYSRAAVTALNAAPTIGGTDCSPQTVMMNTTVASGLTAGSAGALISNNNQTSYLLFSAEL